MKVTHYICSDNQNCSVASFPEFDKEGITKAIIKQLTLDPTDTVTHEKTSTDKRYYGNDIINFYEVNPKSGKPSLVITKGNKQIYKPLI